MTDSQQSGVTRRDVLQRAGAVAAASALAGVAIPHVHAAEDNTIHIALVGCGGRGTGAAINALNARGGPVKLVAMADVFQDRLHQSYGTLQRVAEGKADQRGRAREPEVHRLRRLQAGHGLPAQGRRGHLRDPAGLPLGAFHLRHREGRQRLHGEADRRGRPERRRMLKLGEESVQRGPQGRRRPDVPPLRRPGPSCSSRSSDGAIGDMHAAPGLSPDGPRGEHAGRSRCPRA